LDPADDLTPANGRRLFTSTLRRRSYHQAPVSPLHLSTGSRISLIGKRLPAALGFVAVAAAFDIGLGLAVLAGRNWPRLMLMVFCMFTTTVGFIGNARGVDMVVLTDLPAVGGSILVLLALSSHRARDYAARGRHRPKEIAAETSKALQS